MATEFQAGAGVFVINAYLNKQSVDQATKGLGEGLDKGTKQIEKSGEKLGRSFAASFAIAAAGTAIILSEIEKINQGFNRIRIGTGATGQAFEDLKGVARDVGSSVSNNFIEIGDAVAGLNTGLDITGKDLEFASKQMLDLSKITGEDLNGSISATTRLMQQWNVQSTELVGTTDKLFRATQLSGIGYTKLAQSLTVNQEALSQFGFSLDESTALLASFEKEGVNSELILKSFTRGLTAFSKAGEKPAVAFGRFVEEIKNAKSSFEATDKAVEIFGNRAGPQLAAAIREGRFEFDEMLSTIVYGEETIKGTREATKRLTESLSQFKQQLVLIIEPILQPFLKALSATLELFISLPGPIKNTVVALVSLIAILKYTNIISKFTAALSSMVSVIHLATAANMKYGASSKYAGVMAEAATKKQIIAAKALTVALGPLGAVITGLGIGLAAGWAWNRGKLDEYTSSMKIAIDDMETFKKSVSEWAQQEEASVPLDAITESLVTMSVESSLRFPIFARNFTDLGAKLEQAGEVIKATAESLTDLAKTGPDGAVQAFEKYKQILDQAIALGEPLDDIKKEFKELGGVIQSYVSEDALDGRIRDWIDNFAKASAEAQNFSYTLAENETYIDRWSKAVENGFAPFKQFIDAKKALQDLNDSLLESAKTLEQLRRDFDSVQKGSLMPEKGETFLDAEERVMKQFDEERLGILDRIAQVEQQMENTSSRFLDVGLGFITAQENLVSRIFEMMSEGIDPDDAVSKILSKLSVVVPQSEIDAFQQQIAAPLAEAKAEAIRRAQLTEQEKALVATTIDDITNNLLAGAQKLKLMSLEERESFIAELEASGNPMAAAYKEINDNVFKPQEEILKRLYPEMADLNLTMAEWLKLVEGANELLFGVTGLDEGDTRSNWRKITDFAGDAASNIKDFVIDKFWERAGRPIKVDGAAAEGGPVIGGKTYIVGEEGPEMFVPNRSGTIVPNHDLASGMMGGNNITNVYQTRELSAAELAQEVSYRQGRQLTGRQR